jgi:hypothetical protein
VKKLLPAVVLLAGLLLTGCAGAGTTPAAASSATTSRMSIPDSCKFLTQDTFVPTGDAKQQADQISKHYQEVADKVAPEVGAPIQKMADIMKQVAATPEGTKTGDQTAQLVEQNNKIGEYCK